MPILEDAFADFIQNDISCFFHPASKPIIYIEQKYYYSMVLEERGGICGSRRCSSLSGSEVLSPVSYHPWA
jgi:hypothetical protein